MNVTVEIHYRSSTRIIQKGSFPLRYRQQPVDIAYDYWKQIQKESSYRAELEKVIVNGDQDITEQVLKMEKSIVDDIDLLPF